MALKEWSLSNKGNKFVWISFGLFDFLCGFSLSWRLFNTVGLFTGWNTVVGSCHWVIVSYILVCSHHLFLDYSCSIFFSQLVPPSQTGLVLNPVIFQSAHCTKSLLWAMMLLKRFWHVLTYDSQKYTESFVSCSCFYFPQSAIFGVQSSLRLVLTGKYTFIDDSSCVLFDQTDFARPMYWDWTSKMA